MWDQSTQVAHQLWGWVIYEASLHPFMFLGIVIVIVGAFILYQTEVRGR